MFMVKSVLLICAVVVVVAIAVGQVGLLKGRPPVHLGVREGRLQPPSITPNSVSSQARLFLQHPQQAYADIAPLALKGGGPETVAKIRTVIEAMTGARLVESRPDYLRAEFSTRLLGFVDDAEFWFDPAQRVVQVRSASRLGNKDFGVNRARIEAIRHGLAAL